MPINVPVNVKMLAKSMIDAARQATSSNWTEVRPMAEMQLRTLAHAAGEIDELLRSGQIDEARARELFAFHRTAAQTVLEGTGGTASRIAEVLTRAAVGAIGGRLGGILTSQFKAGKDL
ncbi:MAG TPA: hypothetical protein VF111_11410 [Thermoanaerobaculia bacterium]